MRFSRATRLLGILISSVFCLTTAIAGGDEPAVRRDDSQTRTAELRSHYERIVKELDRATALGDQSEVAALTEVKRNIKNTIEHLGGNVPISVPQRYDVYEAVTENSSPRRPQLFATPPQRVILANHEDDDDENEDEARERWDRRRQRPRAEREHRAPRYERWERARRGPEHGRRHKHRDHEAHEDHEHHESHEHHEHEHAEHGRQFHVRMAAHHLEQAGMEEVAQRVRMHARQLAERERRERDQMPRHFEVMRERIGNALREGRERLEEHGEMLRELAEEVEELDEEMDELESRVDEIEERMKRRRRSRGRETALRALRYEEPSSGEHPDGEWLREEIGSLNKNMKQLVAAEIASREHRSEQKIRALQEQLKMLREQRRSGKR